MSILIRIVLTRNKIEVVLDAARAPPPPTVKGLGDRITYV